MTSRPSSRRLRRSDVYVCVQLRREVQIHSALQHENLVRYHSAWIEPRRENPSRAPEAQQQKQKHEQLNKKQERERTHGDAARFVLFIQMQYCSLTLQQWLEQRNMQLLLQRERSTSTSSSALSPSPDSARPDCAPSASASTSASGGCLSASETAQCRGLLAQLLAGLVYLHQSQILHRDLKVRE